MPAPIQVSLASVVQGAIERATRNLMVATPGIVQSYDPATRTCSVKPGVHRFVPSIEEPDEDLVEELAVEHDVPVCWPAGRGFKFANVSLSAGDPVLLVVCDRDIGPWRASGSASEPMDARLHDMSNCVAIPGLLPASSPFPAPANAAALATQTKAELDDLRTVLNALVTKYNVLLGVLNTAAGGAGTLTPNPAFTATASSKAAVAGIASDVLKLES